MDWNRVVRGRTPTMIVDESDASLAQMFVKGS